MGLCAADVPKPLPIGKSTQHHVPLGRTNPTLTLAELITEPKSADYPRHRCVHELLREQSTRTPDAVAIESEGGRRVTYAALEARSNQVAHAILKRSPGVESLVAVCIDRSIEMVVALLGVLKAGAAYVPLDPAYPSDRIKYVLDDAGATLLLTQSSLLPALPPSSAEILCLDADWSWAEGERQDPPEVDVAPNNLAYVIYTSGSTGRPKGVQLEHRSVVNFLWSMRDTPGMTSNDVLVAVTTLSFDIAGLEIYLPLLVGGKLVIASREATADGRLLMQLLKQSGATIMQATPTTWRVLLESGWAGDRALKVLVGGEALSSDLGRQLAERCGSVWNMYGPTETTIWSSVYKVEGADDKLVPIGQPIANTTFHILDANMQEVSYGTEGELYIGGEGLARGYFQREELTADKFVADPFSATPGARMYRTGDLARYRADGNVEFLGRLDHQVKIRGFRIELGEIEAVLEQHQDVRQAVVLAREDTPGDKRLVAYVVPESGKTFDPNVLLAHAGAQLPDYMTPSAFVQMAVLPLTPNGKVDRKALPLPKLEDLQSDVAYVAPRDATEKKLVALWEEVLGVHPIGVNSNFFELGGRSVLAARLFTKIAHTFHREVPLAVLFRSPTIALLAEQLRVPSAGSEYRTIIPIQETGTRPPFFCVHGGAGGSLFMRELSRRLGPDQPFYGIEPEGLDGLAFRRTTVEAMAEHYLSEIAKVQPKGPYYIGGYCFGGLVAFEMAQQLIRRGEQPAFLGLFSAELRYNHRELPSRPALQPAKPVSARLTTLVSSPFKVVRNLTTAAMWDIRTKSSRHILPRLASWGVRVPPSMRTSYVTQSLGKAERNYKPAPYPGPVVLFYGRDNNEYGPNLGWDGLAEEVRALCHRGRRSP